jgi:amino acid transporter
LTAELSTALPHNGGFVWWVNEAFGPFWAFQEAYWSFVNNLFDLAIYPVMFENYLLQVLPVDTIENYGVRFIVLFFCFVMNFFGVDFVSKVSGYVRKVFFGVT